MPATFAQFAGTGIYSLAEAAKLTCVSSRRIRRWICGYRFKTESGTSHSAPVFQAELPAIEGELAVSFLDLIEIRIVNSLLERKVNWKTIRRAECQARKMFGVSHPFATERFKTDGRSIFTALNAEHDDPALLDLAENQMAFRKVIAPYLTDLDFDHGLHPTRWWPMGNKKRVLLDPERSFGQPIVREGVPTRILAAAGQREKSLQMVARWYEVDLKAVKDAIEFEQKLAA